MRSNKNRLSFGWALGILLGVACSIGVVYAGSITDPDFTNGQTLTFTHMNNIKTAVNGNATDIAAIKDGTATCSSGMVRVGPICVDVYEASTWDAATAGSPVVATRCNKTGNDCSANTASTAIFARSVSGATAAAGFTWFQAQQACANVGKRLLTNAEWQMAAAGTPDTVACVTGSLTNTGVNACVSNWGVHDMVGNLSEWVADWMQGGINVVVPVTVSPSGDTGSISAMVATTGTTDPAYGSHGIDGVSAATAGAGNVNNNFPAAIYRGGDFGDPAGVFFFHANRQPSGASANIGFRCAR